MNHKRLVLALLVLLLINARLAWEGENGSQGITVYGAGTSILTGGGPGTAPVRRWKDHLRSGAPAPSRPGC
jgi:hypothetical protein